MEAASRGLRMFGLRKSSYFELPHGEGRALLDAGMGEGKFPQGDGTAASVSERTAFHSHLKNIRCG